MRYGIVFEATDRYHCPVISMGASDRCKITNCFCDGFGSKNCPAQQISRTHNRVTNIKTGSIWRDNDKRMGGRTVKVVEGWKEGQCHKVTIVGLQSGKVSRTDPKRFGRIGRDGYTLVEEGK